MDDPLNLKQVVDTDRYPVSAPTGSGWRRAALRSREELRTVGCSVLPGFIRAGVVDEVRRECSTVAPLGYYDVETVNVYNTAPGPSLPAGHPARTVMERTNAFVARDRIPEQLIIHRLYSDPLVQRFIACCFDLPRVWELADPLAGLCLNVVPPGKDHPWHFDKNELTVSVVTQAPEAGGSFEYCPNIRSPHRENFDDVRAVLAGRARHLVRSLALRPGDLQLFRGRYALHRVRTVQGDQERHSALFAYADRAGVIGTVSRTRQLFGRVLPAHLAAESDAVRVDQLLD
ncbi:MAG: HalD/BesD family halogenase [Acidimicrobiales bacterium]